MINLWSNLPLNPPLLVDNVVWDDLLISGLYTSVPTGAIEGFIPTLFSTYPTGKAMLYIMEIVRKHLYNKVLLQVNSEILQELKQMNSFIQTGVIRTDKGSI